MTHLSSIVYADFDNTQLMTENQIAVRDFYNLKSMLALRYLVEEKGLNLVHCTGRVFEQINRDIQSGDFSNLPFSVAAKAKTIICGVGTEIYTLNNQGNYVLDLGWQRILDQSGFKEEALKFTDANGLITKDIIDIAQGMVGYDLELAAQEIEKNTSFKKSMWGSCSQLNVSEGDLRNAFLQAFSENGIDIDKIEITVSIQTAKIAIDLTPKGSNFKANKEYACMYHAEKQGVSVTQTYMAGDSGNDSHCINVKGANTILVGNAHEGFVKNVQSNKTPREIFKAFPSSQAAVGLIEQLGVSGVVLGSDIEAAYDHAAIILSDFQHDIFYKQGQEDINFNI
jgi:hydroxymethylpyrimidine pyrophosphatase-like HAD family hydrolase